MLESCVNQASGLQGLAMQVVPRLVAVTSHGNQQGELPLLWGLCATWVELGFAVMVLDGHSHESDQNPGLKQLLDNPLDRFNDGDDPASWSVLPAAQGFEQLATQELTASTFGELFQNYGVVLVYAGTPTMTSLLKDSGLAPLLVVSPLKASTLSAYKALKQLLQDTHLRPTVANIELVPTETAFMQNSSPVQHLQDCAMTFLGYAVKPVTVMASAQPEISRDGLNQLALQMLENAVFLERHPTKRAH